MSGLVEPHLEGDEGAALHGGRPLGLDKGCLGRFRLLLQLLQAVALRGLFLGCPLQLGVAINGGSLLGLQLLLSLLELAGLGGLLILEGLQLSLHYVTPLRGIIGFLPRQVTLDSGYTGHLPGLLLGHRGLTPGRSNTRIGQEPPRDQL